MAVSNEHARLFDKGQHKIDLYTIHSI